ncbi:CD225/dispanin family protein [Kineosporia sp. A_224]|uniref:CD225/dispanin family protein n=1 Tax=Kineosporia sp. A_224 TaxID=1962180 RepID=UPI000B4A9286|nr:CD225/dispanin family protein [Kineosporia sp. A_224]
MSTDGPYPPSAPEPEPGTPSWPAGGQQQPPYGAPAPYGQPGPAQPPAYQQPGGYPAGYPAQPVYGPPAGPPPDNYLVWAILSTVLCCLPLGIVSIVYAAQVNDKWLRGDVAGATESARKAKQFATWSAITYGVLLVLVVIFYIGIFAVALGTGASTAP